MSDQPSNEPSRTRPSGAVIVVSGPGGVGKTSVSNLVAAAFDLSVHLDADQFMASIVSGRIDPNLPEANQQNEAVGGAFAAAR